MTDVIHQMPNSGSWIRDKLFLGVSFPEYLRSLVTPFNIIAFLILCVGLPVTWIRFTQGLGVATNLTDDYPWGLWIGFNVLCGIALAAGGFCLASVVHIFGLRKYYPVVRPAILTGFLGYFFEVIGLCFDLGRPWRLPYPIFVSYGVTSVMFLVGWFVAIYLTVQFIEFCPAIFEWLEWNRVRKCALKITIVATIFGVIIAILHQSALGALFLITPGKLHPLWYSGLIPVLFFISSIAAGISMVIFESMLSHRVFRHQISHDQHGNFDHLALGLGKGAAVVLFTYFCLKWIGITLENEWKLLSTQYGQLWLLEVIGFVLFPCFLYIIGVKRNSAAIVRAAAIWTVLGIIFNRLNVSIFAFNWQMIERYVPSWMEVAVTITIITVALLTFRWIVNRVPVLYVHPNYPVEH